MGRVIRMRTTLQVATIDNRPLRDISAYIDKGKVVTNESASTQWAFSCDLLSRWDLATLELRPWLDFLAPTMEVTYEDGTVSRSQLGLYVVLPAKKQHRKDASELAIDGRDLMYLVELDAYQDTYSVTPADDPLVKIVEVLTSAGIPASRIVVMSKPLAEDRVTSPVAFHAPRDWELGTSKKTIANDMLASIGYYAAFPDDTGRVILMPYRDLEDATPDARYASGPGSMVTGELIEDAPVMTSFANVILVTAGNPATGDAVVPADTGSPTIANGRTVRVTADIGLRLRDGAGLSAPIKRVMPKGTAAVVTGSSTTANGYTWWPLDATIPGVGTVAGWSAANWLEVVPGDPDPVTEPDKLRPPIVALRINDDEASAVSTVALGRSIVRREHKSDIETQAQADELADRLIAESLTYTQKLILRTTPDTRRRLHEVYELDVRRRNGTVVAEGSWRCTGWEVGFTADQATMTHTCYRNQRWSRTEVVG